MSQMWATAPVLAAALLFSGASAERVTAQRTLLEIVDTQSAGCANNWDTATIALRWSHLVVKSVTLNTTAGRACTFSPPAQQCVTKDKLAALRAAGITVMAEVSHPDEAAWKACLDPGRSPTAVLAASLAEAVKDYDGVLFTGVAAQSAALLAAARVALPTSTVAGLSFLAESVNRVNAGQPVNLYDNLPALMTNSSASFVVLVYAGSVSSAAHMRSVAEKVGGIGNVVMGTCYGSANGCLNAKDYLGTLQAATLPNGTLEWDGCVGGTLAMGSDNHFYYDTAALSVIVEQRRVCRDTLATKTILKDNLQTLTASVFAPTSTVVRGSTRLDTSSFVGQFRAFALDSENFPRYPHRVSSVLDQFDSSDQLSEFGLVEEWGCVDGVSQDCGSGTTNGVLGYSDASLDFLKIGVGLLSRPESLRRANYSSTSRAYSMKRALQWQTTVSDDKSSLTMTTSDVLGDFAYTLTRTLTVKPFGIEVERSLKNTGTASFSTAHITSTNFDVDMLDLYYPETAVPRYQTFLRFKGVTPKDGNAGSNAVSESFTQDTCLDGSLCRALAAKDGMFRVADVPRGDVKVDVKTSNLQNGAQDFTFTQTGQPDSSWVVLERQHAVTKGGVAPTLMRIAVGASNNNKICVKSQCAVPVRAGESSTWKDIVNVRVVFQEPPSRDVHAGTLIICIVLVVVGIIGVLLLNKYGSHASEESLQEAKKNAHDGDTDIDEQHAVELREDAQPLRSGAL